MPGQSLYVLIERRRSIDAGTVSVLISQLFTILQTIEKQITICLNKFLRKIEVPLNDNKRTMFSNFTKSIKSFLFVLTYYDYFQQIYATHVEKCPQPVYNLQGQYNARTTLFYCYHLPIFLQMKHIFLFVSLRPQRSQHCKP